MDLKLVFQCIRCDEVKKEVELFSNDSFMVDSRNDVLTVNRSGLDGQTIRETENLVCPECGHHLIVSCYQV